MANQFKKEDNQVYVQNEQFNTAEDIISIWPIIILYIGARSIYIRMVDIFDPKSNPYGRTYEEHIIGDWSRNLSLPLDENPMEDNTGERIHGVSTNSPLVYLSGNTGGTSVRNCGIKSGVGCFISIGDAVYSQGEKPGSTVGELHALAKQDQDNVTDLYLKIDDKEFKFEDLKAYRFHTKDFEVNFPQNGLFSAKPGPSKAVVDGYYVITKGFDRGKHTIVTKASVSDPSWNSEVTYNLEVT